MTTAYPLEWPPGWPRTAPQNLKYAGQRFGQPTIASARDRLLDELRLLGVRTPIVLSSNLELRLDGLPRSGQRRPADPGIAVYFELKGRRLCMAYDLWDRVEDNLTALALAIHHLRGLNRHGGGHMVERAFAGFQALPSAGHRSRSWREVLEIRAVDVDLPAVKRNYRRLAKEHHPDRGGTDALMADLNRAFRDAKQELAG